jgi:hypothetical protein
MVDRLVGLSFDDPRVLLRQEVEREGIARQILLQNTTDIDEKKIIPM